MGRVRKLSAWFLAALVGCSSPDPFALGTTRISEPMPELSGQTLQGGRIEPSDYRGKVVVVNVWGTWCGPCRREQPTLQRVWERFRDRGVAFIGIDWRDDPAAARDWIDEFGVTYPSIPDPSGAWADDFEWVGAPTTYVVDRSGVMRYKVQGEVEEDELESLITELLAMG